MRNHYISFIVGAATMAAYLLLAYAVSAAHGDGFVRTLEMRMGWTPGDTRVVPECGCTVRYAGTTVSGSHYSIHLDKLD